MRLFVMLGIIGLFVPSIAQAQVREGPSQNNPGCNSFFGPNGNPFRVGGRQVAASGQCPGDWLRGNMVAPNQIRLSDGRTCTFDNQGKGTCS